MDKMFQKLMEKKKGSELPEEYKNAKMSTLAHLHDLMSGMAADDLRGGLEGMKKVTVASPDKEGLEEGLEHAKDIMHGLPGQEEDGEESEGEEESEEEKPEAEHMIQEEIDHESAEGDLSPEEIDELIKDLQEKKAKMAVKG